MTPTELLIYRVAAAGFVVLCLAAFRAAGVLPQSERKWARALLAFFALAVLVMALVAYGGGGDSHPPWRWHAGRHVCAAHAVLSEAGSRADGILRRRGADARPGDRRRLRNPVGRVGSSRHTNDGSRCYGLRLRH